MFGEVSELHLAVDGYDALEEDLAERLAGGRWPRRDDPKPPWAPVRWRSGDEEGTGRFRFRGRSSLRGSVPPRRPFRLNLHSPLDGRRKLVFRPGYRDRSGIREKLASDLLRAFDVPAPRAALVRVSRDGVDLGTYTAVEDPSEWPGALYKVDGGTFHRFDPRVFRQRSGQDTGHAEVRGMIEALHANPEAQAWRDGLERWFDVRGFVRWLAANAALRNFDTWGRKARNASLWLSDGVLRWVPWDHAAILTRRGPDPLEFLDDAGPDWPLLSRILGDREYRDTFSRALIAFAEGPFAVETAADRIRALGAAAGSADRSVDKLVSTVVHRHRVLRKLLST